MTTIATTNKHGLPLLPSPPKRPRIIFNLAENKSLADATTLFYRQARRHRDMEREQPQRPSSTDQPAPSSSQIW